MRLFHRRPLAFFAASGILFLYLLLTLLQKGLLSRSFLVLCAGGAALVFALLLIGIRHARRGSVGFFRKFSSDLLAPLTLLAAAALLSSLCILLHCQLGALRVPLTFRDPAPLAVEGEIRRISRTSYNSLMEVKITRFGGEACGFHAVITVPETPEAAVGDLFTAEAVFSLPEETAGGFPLRQYRFSEGIFLQGEVHEAENFEITGHSGSPAARIALLRERIASLSDRRLSSDGSALLRALLLGDRTTLPDAVRWDFKTLGISHLLAVSGLHLAVLCGMLSFLLQRLRLPKKLQLPLLALFCLFFMALCGFSGSVCRAGVMYLSALAAPLFKTRGDGITGLFAGGLLILLLSPWRLFDTGLQLSFLAVLGILTLGRLLLKKPSRRSKKEIKGKENTGSGEETAASGFAATDGDTLKENKWAKFLHKIGNAVLISLKISFAAILFTFPISASISGSISLLSPFATLLFAPLIEGLLLLAPPALMLSFLPGISELLFFLTDTLASLLLFLSSGALYFEKTVLVLHADTLSLVCFGFFLLLAVLLVFRFPEKCLRRLPALLFLGVLLGNALGLWINSQATGTLYCRSGTNEAILLKSGEETLLIDLSAGTGGIRSTALNRLRELPSAGIDALLLTHLHSRHRTALYSLAQECYLKKLYLPLPECEEDRGHYAAIAEEAAHLGIEVISYRRDGVPLSLPGGISFTPAAYTRLSRSTHPAVAFRLDKGELSLLYVGSAFPAEGLVPLGAADADCALFGLHGPIRKESDDDGYRAVFGDTPPSVILADEGVAGATEAFPSRILLPEGRDRLRLRFAE